MVNKQTTTPPIISQIAQFFNCSGLNVRIARTIRKIRPVKNAMTDAMWSSHRMLNPRPEPMPMVFIMVYMDEKGEKIEKLWMFMYMWVVMFAVSMEQMHQWAQENEEERSIGQNMLPVVDERDDHHDYKAVVEPVRNAEVFHTKENEERNYSTCNIPIIPLLRCSAI